MIDDEIDRRQRIDLMRVAAERGDRVAHGREIDYGGHAGEVLHQHARGPESDLLVAALFFEPVGDGADIVGGDAAAVLMAEQVLQQHLEREGQAADAVEPRLLSLLQIEIIVVAFADFERAPALEAVERGRNRRCQ